MPLRMHRRRKSFSDICSRATARARDMYSAAPPRRPALPFLPKRESLRLDESTADDLRLLRFGPRSEKRDFGMMLRLRRWKFVLSSYFHTLFDAFAYEWSLCACLVVPEYRATETNPGTQFLSCRRSNIPRVTRLLQRSPCPRC